MADQRSSFAGLSPRDKRLVIVLSVLTIIIIVAAVAFLRARLTSQQLGTQDLENGRAGQGGRDPNQTFLQRHLATLRSWKKPALPEQPVQPAPPPSINLMDVPLAHLPPYQPRLFYGRPASYYANFRRNNPNFRPGPVARGTQGVDLPRGENYISPANPYYGGPRPG